MTEQEMEQLMQRLSAGRGIPADVRAFPCAAIPMMIPA